MNPELIDILAKAEADAAAAAEKATLEARERVLREPYKEVGPDPTQRGTTVNRASFQLESRTSKMEAHPDVEPDAGFRKAGGEGEEDDVNGALIFVDCEGAEVARIAWVNGYIITEGEQTVESGCGGAPSPSYPSYMNPT